MLQIEFKTENAAFEGGDGPHEVARILREIAGKIETGATDGFARDVNGNTVGTWSLELPEAEEDEPEADPADEFMGRVAEALGDEDLTHDAEFQEFCNNTYRELTAEQAAEEWQRRA